MEALHQPTLRVAAVIAEGVPEQDTKKLIAYARKHNKIILGPATVGGMQVCSLALPPVRSQADGSRAAVAHERAWRAATATAR